MPRPALPPTPGSSTELAGKHDTRRRSSLEQNFALPPPAISEKTGNSSLSSKPKGKALSTDAPSFGPISYQAESPPSPRSIAPSPRRRPSESQQTAGNGSESFVLPPPPTRSRKIIQMKPRPKSKDGAKASLASKAAEEVMSTATAENRRKQPSATSVAGRKIARKTAHSLIERRRRSKMNEEFGVLKDMIPACKDQEMHKLAILQASIEYLRYLEQCVADLRQNSEMTPDCMDAMAHPPQSRPGDDVSGVTSSAEEPDDDEMDTSDHVASEAAPQPISHQRQQENWSPSLLPNVSTSPALHGDRVYSFSANSALVSPTYASPLQHSQPSLSNSVSPTLLPQPQTQGERNIDHEATEALLMLNTDRRRGTGTTSSGKALSVKDLLSP